MHLIGCRRYHPAQRKGWTGCRPWGDASMCSHEPTMTTACRPDFIRHAWVTHTLRGGGDITFAVCVRLQTAPEIPFYGLGLCVCVCVDINTRTARVYLVGKLTCASVGFGPVCGVCLCIHLLQLWLILAIISCGEAVNQLARERTMVCWTPALVAQPRTTVMKRSLPDYHQHLAHIVHLLLLS